MDYYMTMTVFTICVVLFLFSNTIRRGLKYIGINLIIFASHQGLLIFLFFKQWRPPCGYYQHTYILQFSVSHRHCDQTFLMGILTDRLHALTRPYQYNNMTDLKRKKRAKSIILKILLGSVALYFPHFFFYPFIIPRFLLDDDIGFLV